MLKLTPLRFAEAAPAPSAAPAAQPSQPVREAAGTTVDDDDAKWRRLTGKAANRDLPSLSQETMRKMAAYLWETNLLANRLIELPLAYLLAEGVQLVCEDEEHQGWLNAFWNDPINQMGLKLPTYVRELALFGELCWPVFVNEVNGAVRLGYLDPSLIGDVMTDPGNAGQDIGVETIKDANGVSRKFATVLRGEDQELFGQAARQARASYSDGQCFYFAINRFAAGKRGRSDLMAQMDWLDGFDEFMFDQMERNSEHDAFIWDVKLTGSTPEDVEERAKKIQRPNRGSVRVHNDQEEWTAVAPSLNAVDRSESARLFRNYALGGATIPEHWFGGGGDVNRAAAGEMGDPFFKVATARQTFLRHVLQEVGAYVLWKRAESAGQRPDWSDPAWKVTAKFPEMVTRDITKIAAAMQSCVTAVASALADRLISRRKALEIIAVAARRLEVDIDPEEELDAVAKEPRADGSTGAGDETGAGLGVPGDLIEDDDGTGNSAAQRGQQAA